MKSSQLMGTPEGAAALLTDLYVQLRESLKEWAAHTHQTPQPRMGYVGQHLVSVVTGYPGGRSGARGDDLILPGGRVAEIKCCYRVDQLGRCAVCGTRTASVEEVCPSPSCGSAQIVRNDDSKWLLSPSAERELEELFSPQTYYLVLFEFDDVTTSADINVKVFTVDPRSPGFALCMIDYFFNIRPRSTSHAPFNLWPASLKFAMMKPVLIYHAIIDSKGTIRTHIFPGINPGVLQAIPSLPEYASARTISEGAIDSFASVRNVALPAAGLPSGARRRKTLKLQVLQEHRLRQAWDDRQVADDLARAVYESVLLSQPDWVNRFSPPA